jgi:hypothetical protein
MSKVRSSEPLGDVMSTVVMHNVVSVDGFIATAEDQVGPLFDWYGNGDVELGAGKVSQASAEYVRPVWASIWSMVVGRHLFDITNGWKGRRRRASTLSCDFVYGDVPGRIHHRSR